MNRPTREERMIEACNHLREVSKARLRLYSAEITPYFTTSSLAKYLGYKSAHLTARSIMDEMVENGMIQRRSFPYRGVSGKKHLYYLLEFDTQLEMFTL